MSRFFNRNSVLIPKSSSFISTQGNFHAMDRNDRNLNTTRLVGINRTTSVTDNRDYLISNNLLQ